MKLSRFIFWAIVVIALIVLNSIWDLSYRQWTTGSVCPPLLGMPACYPILTAVILLLVSHFKLYKGHLIGFFIGAGVPWSVAVYASVRQFIEMAQCPKTTEGIPYCYISLAMFTTIIVLKFIQLSLNKK